MVPHAWLHALDGIKLTKSHPIEKIQIQFQNSNAQRTVVASHWNHIRLRRFKFNSKIRTLNGLLLPATGLKIANLMSQSITTAYIPPGGIRSKLVPGVRDLTTAGHLTNKPTNVTWQFNSIISYFCIFCMDKCMQMSSINLDKKILMSESMKMVEKKKQKKLME